MSIRHSPIRPSTSFVVLVFDWLVFAASLDHFDNWLPATICGALATMLVVAIIERRAGASLGHMSWNSVLAGSIVAVPLPLLGTLFAVTGLIWSALTHRHEQRAQ